MAALMLTYSIVVAHASALLGELIADPLLWRHLLSVAAAANAGGGQHTAATLHAFSLMSDVLNTAPSASPSPSSLRAAELTAEFYWPKAMTTMSKVKLNLPVVDEMKYQYQEEPARRRNYKDLKEDEVKLVRKMTEMEMELQAVKASKKKLKKFYREEMRSREKREMIIFGSVAAIVLFYVVSVLLVRGFT